MKITKKSFQAFFTRASLTGLLLGGVAAARAQTSGTLNRSTSTSIGATLATGVTLTETVNGTQLIITAVPEPGTWAAVAGGLGILGSLQYARRRNRRV